MAMASREIIFAWGIASLLVAYAGATELPKFGYKGSIGPDHWGSLSPDFQLCSSGTSQSPIKIVKEKAVYNSSLEALKRKYVDANATLVNNGFNIELRYEEGVGNVLVDGKTYSLQRLHWHSPSEHTIDGERYPVELHLVHRSEDGNTTVVAILYKYGHADPFLFQLKDKLEELAKDKCSGDEEAQIPAGVIESKAINRATRKYFRYVGSLTIPPCTEKVIWIILGKVREMTPEQASALKAPLDVDYQNNSRPTQSLNGRTVQLYDETQHAKHHSL